MNRITAAFARMEAQIAARIEQGLTTADKVAESGKSLDMDMEEYVKFQTLKSLAVAMGKLTEEEGMTVYACLGETLSTFNDQPVHVKFVLNGLFRELLQARIEQAGGKVPSPRKPARRSASRS